MALRVVPVVALDDVASALPLANALVAGGLGCMEITFRTAAAAASIKAVSEACGAEMLVGAGTVLSVAQVDQAIEAGAQFIVTPALNEEVVRYCLARRIAIFPGAVTATEVDRAYNLGLRTVKFFPAGTSGGVAAIKSLGAPYGMMRFMPTGGVNAKNLGEYLANPKIVACGGSWMVSQSLFKDGDFSEVTRLAIEAVAVANA